MPFQRCGIDAATGLDPGLHIGQAEANRLPEFEVGNFAPVHELINGVRGNSKSLSDLRVAHQLFLALVVWCMKFTHAQSTQSTLALSGEAVLPAKGAIEASNDQAVTQPGPGQMQQEFEQARP